MSRDAATEAEADASGTSSSFSMPDTTNRQRRWDSLDNWSAPASTTRETPFKGNANNLLVSNRLDSGRDTDRLCPPLNAPHNQVSTSALPRNFIKAGCSFFARWWFARRRHFPATRSTSADQATSVNWLASFS